MANGHRTQIKRERNAQKDTRPSAKLSYANAENNLGMNPANLYIAECMAFEGPTMKRVRPRAQGRAYRILKRMSNLKIVLDEKKVEE